MEQVGEYRIGAPREVVWRALNDPAVLARCIDGCRSFEAVGDDRYAAVVKAKVGSVNATFHAEFEILEPDPPLALSVAGQIRAGLAGFGRGSAHVSLTDEGDVTLLHYTVDGSLGGRLARVGQDQIDATGRKMADDFFAAFAGEVGPGAGRRAPAAASARPESRWLTWLVAGAALVAAAVCLWLLLR